LFTGVGFGLIGGLIGGLMRYGLIFGLGYGLIFGLCLALIFGLIFGLKYGGTACIQHFTLRQLLHEKGRIPQNYTRFLDFVSDRLLMKKSGVVMSFSIVCF
jgi:hypothetical protein